MDNQYALYIYNAPANMVFCGKGEKAVEIDLHTGEVTLYKPANEAAVEFWDAVKKLVPRLTTT